MTRRTVVSIAAPAAAMCFTLLSGVPAMAQSAGSGAAASGQNWTPPRTADGHPDLEGFYSNATTVPLERPKNLGAKEFYTPEELAAKNARPAVRAAGPAARPAGRPAPAGSVGADGTPVHYDTSQFGLDRSHETVAQSLRTSQIVGPDGQIPPMTEEAKTRVAERQAVNRGHQFDSASNRALSERCILWPNEGPPMLPPGYNDNLQIVQTPKYVAILQEMIHDARIIPTDGSPHPPENVRFYMGDSRGHWEGDTLVVDTTNFTDKTAFRNSSEHLHVIERFTRTSADTVTYQFTVEDPHTWEKPWTAELALAKTDGPIYEYACHEANYGMANILSGVRATEAAEAAKAK
jgi:hypothetical protein